MVIHVAALYVDPLGPYPKIPGVAAVAINPASAQAKCAAARSARK